MKLDWSPFGIEPNSTVNDGTISQIQKLFGMLFPQSYLALVTYADKASPEVSSFPYAEGET